MRKQDDELKSQPRPLTEPISEAPSEGILFILQAGIQPEAAAERYGAAWLPRHQRVFLPVLDSGEETGAWTARAVLRGQSPKYLASKLRRSGYYPAQQDRIQQDAIVVVEDLLSAYKVSMAGFDTVAAMGTAIGADILNRIDSDRKMVFGWFDDDKAGHTASSHLSRSLRLTESQYVKIKSDRDPKLHSKQQIQELLHVSK